MVARQTGLLDDEIFAGRAEFVDEDELRSPTRPARRRPAPRPCPSSARPCRRTPRAGRPAVATRPLGRVAPEFAVFAAVRAAASAPLRRRPVDGGRQLTTQEKRQREGLLVRCDRRRRGSRCSRWRPPRTPQSITNPAEHPAPITVTIDGQTYNDGAGHAARLRRLRLHADPERPVRLRRRRDPVLRRRRQPDQDRALDRVGPDQLATRPGSSSSRRATPTATPRPTPTTTSAPSTSTVEHEHDDARARRRRTPRPRARRRRTPRRTSTSTATKTTGSTTKTTNSATKHKSSTTKTHEDTTSSATATTDRARRTTSSTHDAEQHDGRQLVARRQVDVGSIGDARGTRRRRADRATATPTATDAPAGTAPAAGADAAAAAGRRDDRGRQPTTARPRRRRARHEVQARERAQPAPARPTPASPASGSSSRSSPWPARFLFGFAPPGFVRRGLASVPSQHPTTQERHHSERPHPLDAVGRSPLAAAAALAVPATAARRRRCAPPPPPATPHAHLPAARARPAGLATPSPAHRVGHLRPLPVAAAAAGQVRGPDR